MIYSDILREIKTLDSAQELISDIDILMSSQFSAKPHAFEESLRKVSAYTSQAVTELLAKNSIDFNDKSAIKEFLNNLKDKVQKLKILKLSLAFMPSESMIDTLFSWVSKNLAQGIVLDIEEDKTIIGGANIAFEGKYKDLSVRKTLEQTFANKREEIIKSIE